jgi:hypothetical protein
MSWHQDLKRQLGRVGLRRTVQVTTLNIRVRKSAGSNPAAVNEHALHAGQLFSMRPCNKQRQRAAAMRCCQVCALQSAV